MLITVGPDQVEEVDRIFASHAEWMEKTHHRDGDLALLSYNVCKGAEVSNPLDPASEPTGNTTYSLTEVYETPAGLADHWKQGQESWQDFSAFLGAAQGAQVAVLHGSPVIRSLW